jgi:DNA replication protein DnaC
MQQVENTIQFTQAPKPQRLRPIDLVPRTRNQERLVMALQDADQHIVVTAGPAGTGKTYTGVALAVKALKEKRVKRIILTRPAVEAGENLGFLPGDMKEKLDPYMQPLYDALRDMLPPQTLEDYIREILLEYDKGSQIAKKIIFDLVKDPLRQNISEEVQEQIANEKGFKIEKLPQSGKNCLRIYQGKVVRSSELTKKEKELSSKSLDFKLINEKKPNLKFFTYNKYNKWVGGSTDDVFNDVRHLIENFENAKDKSIVLVIILDGYYWDLNRRKLQSYQNENLIITSSDELTILNETPELH